MSLKRLIAWGSVCVGEVLCILTFCSCNLKQGSQDISKDLADKLTDSMSFDNGQKKSGEKPLGHAGDVTYPQVTNVIVEQNGNLYETAFTWKAAFDYQGSVADITGAFVHVANASSYFDVKLSVQQQGQLAVLTGTFTSSSQDIIGKSFTIELALYTAKGAGGYYEGLSVTPTKGKPSSMSEPNAAQDAFLFGGGDEQTDSFAGQMPEGNGEVSGAPQISEVLMPEKVRPGAAFEVEIPFTYSGGVPSGLLFQVDGASSFVKLELTSGQVVGSSVKVTMQFNADVGSGVGSAAAVKSVGTTGHAVVVGNLKLWFALVGDKGLSGKRISKNLTVADDAPLDAGYDGGPQCGNLGQKCCNGEVCSGSDLFCNSENYCSKIPADAGFDAGLDMGLDAGEDGGTDGGPQTCDYNGAQCCKEYNRYCYEGVCESDAGSTCVVSGDGGVSVVGARFKAGVQAECGYSGTPCCEDTYSYCEGTEEQGLYCATDTCINCGNLGQSCCEGDGWYCRRGLKCGVGIKCEEPSDGGTDGGGDAGNPACSNYNDNCCYGSALYCNTGTCSAGKCTGQDGGVGADGGSASDGGICGYIGMDCCPTSQYYCLGTPVQELSCVGGEYCGYCGQSDQNCCADKGNWCEDKTVCKSGSCLPCGGNDGEYCCLDKLRGTYYCNDMSLACNYNDSLGEYVCEICGNKDKPCCEGGVCNDYMCDVYNICVSSCGYADETCCYGQACYDEWYGCLDNVCKPCGLMGQPCCDGALCNDYMCDYYNICGSSCGQEGETCCYGGVCFETWDQCIGGVCQGV